jgi:flagellar M-ring protein FliF
VRAQVSADVDFTVVEQTQERFDPASQVLRSEQTNEERRAPGTLTGGLPGALSNQPPGPAILAPPPASTAAQTATNANSAAVPSAEAAAPALPPQDVSRRSPRNYEIDKTVSRISQPLGMVRRLSIAVLVDDWEKAGADGAVTKTPLTETDLARLTALVKESVGFNAARGDSINVVNQSFKNLDVGDGTREVPWWANPGLMDVMTKGFAMIVVLAVLLMIIRPLMRRLHTSSTARSAQMVSPLALPAGTEESGLARDRISLTRLAAPAAADDVASAQPYEIRRDAARTLAARHPEQVAQVMRDWMGQDG